MGHSSDSIRITALSFIAHDATNTEPFSLKVLHILQQIIPYFHAEANPRVRNEFIVIMKSICTRLERGFSIVSKSLASHQAQPTFNSITKATTRMNMPDGDSLSKTHIVFSKWYINLLLGGLQPTASYQYHITTLKILEFLFHEEMVRIDSNRLFHPFKIVNHFSIQGDRNFFGSSFVRLILDLVMDPFDDVRMTAGKLLQLVLSNQYPWSASSWSRKAEQSIKSSIQFQTTTSRPTNHAYILYVLNRAEPLMYRTGRADHADGIGRLYYLLYNSCQNFSDSTPDVVKKSVLWSSSGWSIIDHLLSELGRNISIAQRDLRVAVRGAPFHGNLIALR